MSGILFYWELVRLQYKIQLEYRAAFWLTFVFKIIGWGSGFFMIWILLQKFNHIAGWTTYEVLFLYSFDVLSYSIIGSFLMKPCSRLPGYIQTGEFDGILTKPVNSFFYFIFRVFSTGYISNIWMCLTVLVLCIWKLGLSLTMGDIFYLIITIIGASLIQGAGFLISSIPAFWIGKTKGLKDLFTSDLREFIRYPISIYHNLIQLFITFVVPYAFINYYPVQYFLKKQDAALSYNGLGYLTLLIGLGLFSGCYLLWMRAINSYESTGS